MRPSSWNLPFAERAANETFEKTSNRTVIFSPWFIFPVLKSTNTMKFQYLELLITFSTITYLLSLIVQEVSIVLLSKSSILIFSTKWKNNCFIPVKISSAFILLHYEWFLQNLEKDFIRTFMHATELNYRISSYSFLP